MKLHPKTALSFPMALFMALCILCILSVGCFTGQRGAEEPNTPDVSQDTMKVTRDPENPMRGWVLMGSGTDFVPVLVRLESGVWVLDRSVVQQQEQPDEEKPSFEEMIRDYEELRRNMDSPRSRL